MFKILLTCAPKFYGTKFHIHTKHEAKFRKQVILKPAISLSYGINLTGIVHKIAKLNFRACAFAIYRPGTLSEFSRFSACLNSRFAQIRQRPLNIVQCTVHTWRCS